MRIIKCEEDHVLVEDSSGIDTIMIENGFLWVGMIVTLRIVWEMGKYHYKETLSRYQSSPRPPKNITIHPGQNQTRISLVSGPFTEPTEI